MIILEEKYVLHIPCYKREEGQLEKIDTLLIEELIENLEKEGYTSLYKTKVTGYYKTRSFDEILLTIFTSEETENQKPDEIFRQWYNKNRKQLKQESYAYEKNDTMIIESMD